MPGSLDGAIVCSSLHPAHMVSSVDPPYVIHTWHQYMQPGPGPASATREHWRLQAEAEYRRHQQQFLRRDKRSLRSGADFIKENFAKAWLQWEKRDGTARISKEVLYIRYCRELRRSLVLRLSKKPFSRLVDDVFPLPKAKRVERLTPDYKGSTSPSGEDFRSEENPQDVTGGFTTAAFLSNLAARNSKSPLTQSPCTSFHHDQELPAANFQSSASTCASMSSLDQPFIDGQDFPRTEAQPTAINYSQALPAASPLNNASISTFTTSPNQPFSPSSTINLQDLSTTSHLALSTPPDMGSFDTHVSDPLRSAHPYPPLPFTMDSPPSLPLPATDLNTIPIPTEPAYLPAPLPSPFTIDPLNIPYNLTIDPLDISDSHHLGDWIDANTFFNC